MSRPSSRPTRKNFAALTTANTTAVESMKAIAQRQGDMVRAAMEDFSKHGSDVLGAATVEEKAAKQIDFVKKSYEARHRQHQGADRALQQGPHRGVRRAEPPRRRADRRGQGRDRQEVIRRPSRRPEKGPLRGPFFCYAAGIMDQITYDDFTKVDIRVGTILEAAAARRRAQAGVSAVDRFRARDRRQEILGPAHRALHARQPGRPPGRGGGQLPAAPDRQVHVARC